MMAADLQCRGRAKLLALLERRRCQGEASNDNAAYDFKAPRSALSVQSRDRLLVAGDALQRRGARAVAELLSEVAEREGDASWLLERLAAYNRLPPYLYTSVGADCLPPPVIREVP